MRCPTLEIAAWRMVEGILARRRGRQKGKTLLRYNCSKAEISIRGGELLFPALIGNSKALTSRFTEYKQPSLGKDQMRPINVASDGQWAPRASPSCTLESCMQILGLGIGDMTWAEKDISALRTLDFGLRLVTNQVPKSLIRSFQQGKLYQRLANIIPLH
jgi:hypothetical protein